MEDGLLLCCLCFSSLPIRRISIAHSQFHPPIHPDGAPNTPRAARQGVERFARARFAVGCWIESLFFHATLLFFLRQKRGRSRANGFLGMSEALRGQL